MVSAWKHQLEVTRDARHWADIIDEPTLKERAEQTARRDQQIADDLKALVVRQGCPVS